MSLLLALACRAPVPEPSDPVETTPSITPWPEGDRVIVGTTVVDADGARGPVHVVLDGPVIAALVAADVEVPAGLDVVDGEGRFVVPGLIDPHVHLFLSATPEWVGDTLPDTLRAQLRHGVTSVVDAGGPPGTLALRDRIAAGEVLGPSVKALGPFVTTALSHPCELVNDPATCLYADDAAAGAAAADHLIALGTDGVKVALADADFTPWPTPRLPLDALQAAVAPIAAAGGLTYAHTDEVADALDALDAGVTHLAHPVFGGPDLTPSEASDVAARATAVHTTVSAFSGPLDLLDGALPTSGPAAPPPVVDVWEALRSDSAWATGAYVTESRAWTDAARTNLALLADAGAPLLPASDAGYWFVPHGLGLHRELAELEALGFSRLEVLAAATAGAAEAVGWDDRGRVAPGLRADLLVLDADPRDGLDALADPTLVVLAGVPWEASALETVDVRLSGEPGPAGAFCLDDRDCAGACDPVARTCTAPCEPAWALDQDCGPEAWCMPEDGLDAPAGVCHADRACDPYDPTSCAPAAYEETCAPTDLDTAVCTASGPRLAGQACSWDVPELRCEPGLFCSNVDGTCYTLCDPALGARQPVCGPTLRCRMQPGAGQPWFGLCL